jgi:hypothetical protein
MNCPQSNELIWVTLTDGKTVQVKAGERDPVTCPQLGDILFRPDGLHTLVDYVDHYGFVGFMTIDGLTGRHRSEGWTSWMAGSTVIELGSDSPFTQTPPTREESAEYLQKRIKLYH